MTDYKPGAKLTDYKPDGNMTDYKPGAKMTDYKPDEQDSIPDKSFMFLFPIWNYSLAHFPIHYVPVVPFSPVNVAGA